MVIATLAAMISYYPRFRWRLMDERKYAILFSATILAA
jgi:hypothetical protein